jgi:hypothetical protein
MCSVCVMAAAAGATGARTGLQALKARWLTRRRLRVLTAVPAVCAFGVASVGVSGSTPDRSARHESPPVASR